MGRSPAKRERQWREHVKKLKDARIRENPVRSAMALPGDIKLEDVMWTPDHLELIADLLHRMKARWEREDTARRQQRLKEVLAAVEADKRAGYLP